MEIKEVLLELELNSEFKQWRKSHSDDFLAHAFVMLDEANIDSWQIGFFNSKQNQMTTFIIEKDSLKMIPDQEILKSDIGIFALSADEVKVSIHAALNLATQILRREYSGKKCIKTFFIIQQLRDVPVYNITFFTQDFKTINIKINAANETILHHSMSAVADFS